MVRRWSRAARICGCRPVDAGRICSRVSRRGLNRTRQSRIRVRRRLAACWDELLLSASEQSPGAALPAGEQVRAAAGKLSIPEPH